MKIELEFFDARCYFPQPGEVVLCKLNSGGYATARYHPKGTTCIFITDADEWMVVGTVVSWARLPA